MCVSDWMSDWTDWMSDWSQIEIRNEAAYWKNKGREIVGLGVRLIFCGSDSLRIGLQIGLSIESQI